MKVYHPGARIMRALLLLSILFGSFSNVFAKRVYQKPEEFVAEAFAGDIPTPQRIWLTGDLVKTYRDVMEEEPPQLRLRYWQQKNRSVWILQAVGKEHPITAGFIVEDGKLQLARVLIFRESRGWEIRHPFFTRQFEGAGLGEQQQLDTPIDGITGATLSVRAMSNMARMALVLANRVNQADDTP